MRVVFTECLSLLWIGMDELGLGFCGTMTVCGLPLLWMGFLTKAEASYACEDGWPRWPPRSRLDLEDVVEDRV